MGQMYKEGQIDLSGAGMGDRGDEIPQDFFSFEDYVNESRISRDGNDFTVRFASIPAVLEAAWKLVRFYKITYEQGAFYSGNLRKYVYFHSKTGQIMFRDVHGMKKFGTQINAEDRYNEYRAPELVLGETDTYTQETENWTLAVYLYELFYHSGGPFKGFKSMHGIFFSQEEEYRWMAQEGVFTMEDNFCENRPVHGVQDRLIKYWEVYPEELRQCFNEIFVDGKNNVQVRKTPRQWQRVLNQIKTDYIVCSCGHRGFISEFKRTADGHYCCPVCSKTYYTFESGESRVYLCDGTKLLQCQINPQDTENNACAGMVVENRQRKGVFGIKNMSSTDWIGVGPGGAEKVIAPGGGIPLWQGLQITFGENCTWRIKGEAKNDGCDES